MPQTRATRTLRGSVVAVFSTLVALFSHILGGGEVPAFVGIAVPLLISVALCVGLSGRRVSLVKLAIAVTASQFLFHTMFVLGAGGLSSSVGTVAGHSHHGAVQFTAAAASHAGHGGGAMWIAHLVAGLITVAILYRSEVVFATLSEATRFVIVAVLRVTGPLAVTPLRRSAPRADSVPARSFFPPGFFPALTARRGPPLAA